MVSSFRRQTLQTLRNTQPSHARRTCSCKHQHVVFAALHRWLWCVVSFPCKIGANCMCTLYTSRTRTSVSSAMTATSYCSPSYDISFRLPLHQPVLDELTACISDDVPERHYLPVQKHMLFVTHLPRNACLFPGSCLLSSDTSEYDPAILIRRHFVMEPSLLPSCQTPHIWCC